MRHKIKEPMMAIISTIQKTKFFAGLSQQTLQAIAELGHFVSFEEGDKIYEFGDDALDAFLVESGRVRFSLGVGNRPESSGSIMSKGMLFGWAALLEEQPRRVATATCLEASSLFVFPGNQLLALFNNDTSSGYLVMRRLATLITRDFMSIATV
jgi:CRP-like cAMP-binding protein